MSTTTPNLNLNKPAEGDTDWAGEVNDNWDTLDNAVVAATIVDAKGDLLAGTGADALARLAVGSDGQVLVADSSESTGIEWSANIQDVGSGIISMPNQSAVSVSKSATQDIATSTFTKFQLDSENFDVQSEYDSSTNYRFTATKAGKYLVTLHVRPSEAFGDQDFLYSCIYKNGVVVDATETQASSASAYPTSRSTILLDLAVNDYVEGYIYHNYGANREFRSKTNGNFMCIAKVA